MNSEQGQRQLEKWRRQERFNKILIRCVVGFVLLVALAGLALVTFNWLKGVPTLTPSALVKEYSARDRQVIRLQGWARPVGPAEVRVEDRDASIRCQFAHSIEGLKEGDTVTVEGTVNRFRGLTRCRLIAE